MYEYKVETYRVKVKEEETKMNKLASEGCKNYFITLEILRK